MSSTISLSRTAAIPIDIRPEPAELTRIARRSTPSHRTVPIFREMLGDLETPVSVYLKITDGLRRPGFLLESVEGGIRIARYSFIGTDPSLSLTMRGNVLEEEADGETTARTYHDPLTALGEVLDQHRATDAPYLPRFTGGAVGYLSFDAIAKFEPRVTLARGVGLGMPEARFHVADSLIVFDHLERSIKIVAHVRIVDGEIDHESYVDAVRTIEELTSRIERSTPAYDRRPLSTTGSVSDRFRPNTTVERYREMVERAKQYIHAGDIFQVVPSQRVDIDTDANAFTIYRSLRVVNPSPYMFFLDFGDHQIVGASPELLVRLEDGIVTNHPIAGTRPRGATTAEDEQHAVDLLADEKERAEHIMLVDLGRNDVGRVSRPGSVRVPKLMEIERFSHVMHLVSHVEGAIADDHDGLSALRACFPAGTVSGAPKIRAMEIISEMESDRRGPYAGAVGYFDFAGGIDTCIALRTLVYKDGVASLQAGGGVVADSVPETEYAESLHKMRALVRAIERAEQIEAVEHERESGAVLA